MFVPFEKLPPHSRVWIYQSNKLFTAEQKQILSEALRSFTETWTAHGAPMKASFQLPYDHFIVLAADEQTTSASGCSIDDSVRTIKMIGSELGIDFFDRKNVPFLNNNAIELISLSDLKINAEAGKWNGQSSTVNTLVGTADELSRWIVPAGETWLKRYLSRDSVSK
jgi:hypothetical protein